MIQTNIIDKTIYINRCKAFFIISVAFAHCPLDVNLDSLAILEKIWMSIGTIGVVGFFILSGFWFNNSKKSIKAFIKGKIKTIIIPWLFCGTAVYIVTSIGGEIKKSEDITRDYLNFIIGNGSLYYYLTVLLLLYIILWPIRRNNGIILVLLFLSPVSILLTQTLSLYMINPYLNIFNWISYFGLGMYINNKNLQNQLLGYIQKNRVAVTICFLMFLTLSATLSQNTYFHFLNIFTELCGVAMIVILSLNAGAREKTLPSIGNVSFTIYLVHIPIAGFLNIAFADFNIFFLLIKPFIVIILTFAFLYTYKHIVNRIIRGDKWKKVLLMVVGIKG